MKNKMNQEIVGNIDWEELVKLKDMPSEKYRISQSNFKKLRDMLQNLSGINLNDSKKVMLESRLRKRLFDLNIQNYAEYIDLIGKDLEERSYFINVLTTNKTDFFREIAHFDFFKEEILPTKTHFKIWSAAASTGEEVYSLAMLIDDYSRLVRETNFKILGTDINDKVLQQAKSGIYRMNIADQIPPDYFYRYFLKNKNDRNLCKIDPNLNWNIKFRKFNLIEDGFLTPIAFDVIFLRNVLIYFEQKTIERVISNVTRYLAPNGYLFIGHSESINNINHNLSPVKTSIYKRVL